MTQVWLEVVVRNVGLLALLFLPSIVAFLRRGRDTGVMLLANICLVGAGWAFEAYYLEFSDPIRSVGAMDVELQALFIAYWVAWAGLLLWSIFCQRRIV
jgi:uncharacterized membrane protein YqaE (UPF0057 family)